MLLATMAVPIHTRMAVERALLVTQGDQRVMQARLVAFDAHQQGVAGRGRLLKSPL